MKKFITKLPLWMAGLLVIFFSCEQENHSLSELKGIIRFGGISLEFEPIGSSGSRITGNSTWVHVFPNSADLVFTNKDTGKEYILEYNPNDFSTPYSITLPFGAYKYHSIVEGGVFTEFLPFVARGEFFLDSQSMEISLKAETDFGLVTVKDQYLEKASISDGNKESDLVLPQDSKHWFIYVKGGTAVILKIKESFKGSTIIRDLNIVPNKHYNFILKLKEGSAAITDLSIEPFELEEEEILIGSSSKFFEENGTIKCPGAIPGEKGMVNDKIYEAVDRALLIIRRDEGADLTCACTSLVIDMSGIFKSIYSFNQPIGNWDVSNTTNMSEMFREATNFNEPIGNWDVSKVENMSGMFGYAHGFNQPIGNWDVSNVSNMSHMFLGTRFNQPIGEWNVEKVNDMSFMFADAYVFNQSIASWDVSKVTNMHRMFYETWSFNQPLGDWDVSNVVNMSMMFLEAHLFNQPIEAWDVGNVENMSQMFRKAYSFNQPIGTWNVGKVTNMSRMFSDFTIFNQPIGDWDVSNVINMSGMFDDSEGFNQDLSKWCVINIPSNPGFSGGGPLTEENMPIWGTCPD